MRCIALVGLAASGIVGLAAQASILTYNAGLGTLPTDQGWDFGGDTAAGAAVSGGILSYGPTSFAGLTYWSHTPEPIAMDFSADTYTLSADLRLTDSTFGNVSGFRRAGFNLYLSDASGNWVIAELGSSTIGLRNDNNGLSDPAASVTLDDAFHLVTLEAGPSGARLLVDGVEKLTIAFGTGVAPNSAHWGESSILAGATLTEIRGVTLVPAPTGAAAFLLVGLLNARRRR